MNQVSGNGGINFPGRMMIVDAQESNVVKRDECEFV